MNKLESRPSEKRSNKLFQVLLVLVIIVVGFLGSKLLINTAPKAEKRAQQKQARLVEVLEVQPTSVQISVKGFGVVKAEQQVQLQAQVTGQIEWLAENFIPGSTVKKGEILTRIDPRDYELNLANAKANVASAEANLAREQGDQVVAQSDFEMLNMKVSEKEKTLILRKPQLKAAQAALESAKAEVERAQLNLERTQIKAPFDAIVTERQASLGLLATANTQIGALVKSDVFWAEVSIPQQQLKWLQFPSANKPGSEVCAKDASLENNDCHPGKVLRLQRQVEDQGRQAKVLVELNPNKNKQATPLLLSQYVQVQFKGPKLSDVIVLNPAYVHGQTVWLNDGNTLKVQPVKIIYRAEDQVIVSEGLQAGQKLITSNLSTAIDGMAIRTGSEGQ